MDLFRPAIAALVTLQISGITSLTSQTPSERLQMAPIAAGNRNTLPLSNATFARSVSLERTISARTSAHTLTSGHSFAQSVAKHSLDSTIANATKVFTPARKSLSAEALCKAIHSGAADADSHVPMLWAGILGQKLAVSASSLCSTKKPPRGRRPGWKSISRHKSQQAWSRRSRW